MKTIYNVKALCVFAFLGMAAAAGAQEDVSKDKNLNREMTLEREYDPSVQDASKVNTLPEIKEPEVRKIPIDYATYTVAAEPEKEIGLLPSGNIMTQMNYNKRRGYFNFGGGTYLNLNGDLGYHILSTEADQLNFWFSHRSTNGNVKYIDTDRKVKAKLNDNLGGLDFRHQFDRSVLKLGAKYGYSAFNYYGLPLAYDLGSNGPATLPEQLPGDRETNQGSQTIRAYVGIESNESASVGYLLDVAYRNFSYKYGWSPAEDGPTEQAICANFDLNSAFNGNMRIGLGGNVNYFAYDQPGFEWVDLMKMPFENHADITLSPYYKVEGENWHIQLGANVMFYTGDEHKFMASPDVAMDFVVADKTVLYLLAGGKLYSNSLYDMARLNRYVDPAQGVTPSRNWVDARLGLKCGAAPGFWFDVFGGFKKTSDDVFFVPSFYSREDGFANMSHVLGHINSDHLFIGLNLKYSYQQFLDLALKGVYNHWKLKNDGTVDAPSTVDDWEAYGKPKMEVTASVTVKPIEPLALMLDYYLATDRYTLLEATNVKMKNINELNLTGSYTFNETFGVYAKLNNILGQKYEVIYGYPLQNFSAMVGVNLNF